MLEIARDKFVTFTEIVTRWESGYDLPSPTVKSIRDRLLPLVASLRGFCVTPEDALATAGAEEPENWRQPIANLPDHTTVSLDGGGGTDLVSPGEGDPPPEQYNQEAPPPPPNDENTFGNNPNYTGITNPLDVLG
jgi:hypothetical protein